MRARRARRAPVSSGLALSIYNGDAPCPFHVARHRSRPPTRLPAAAAEGRARNRGGRARAPVGPARRRTHHRKDACSKRSYTAVCLLSLATSIGVLFSLFASVHDAPLLMRRSTQSFLPYPAA